MTISICMFSDIGFHVLLAGHNKDVNTHVCTIDDIHFATVKAVDCETDDYGTCDVALASVHNPSLVREFATYQGRQLYLTAHHQADICTDGAFVQHFPPIENKNGIIIDASYTCREYTNCLAIQQVGTSHAVHGPGDSGMLVTARMEIPLEEIQYMPSKKVQPVGMLVAVQTINFKDERGEQTYSIAIPMGRIQRKLQEHPYCYNTSIKFIEPGQRLAPWLIICKQFAFLCTILLFAMCFGFGIDFTMHMLCYLTWHG